MKILLLANLLLLLALTTSVAAIECRSSKPTTTRDHWSWRLIDGRKCWYVGKRGMDRTRLHWIPAAIPAAPEPPVRAPVPIKEEPRSIIVTDATPSSTKGDRLPIVASVVGNATPMIATPAIVDRAPTYPVLILLLAATGLSLLGIAVLYWSRAFISILPTKRRPT